MTQKVFENIYKEFSKHLDYVSKKYNISIEDVCNVICNYLRLNYNITNIEPQLDDNVNFD